MSKRLFLLLLSFIFLTGCSSNKIDLSQYADISISGYNGYGNAKVNIDWSAFETEILKDDENNSIEAFAKIAALEDSIEYSVDKPENLSSGDNVNLIVNWSENIAKKYKVAFTAKNKTLKVENLEEARKVDLFENVHLEYEGVSPDARAILINASSDKYLKTIYYQLDKEYKIANGDKVVVTANITEEDALRKGIIFDTAEKTFMVENIDEYITEYSEIDEAILDRMRSQAEDLIESEIAEKYSFTQTLYPGSFLLNVAHDSVNIIDKKLKHSYFFALKPGINKGFNDVENSIFLVYEIKFTTNVTKEGAEDAVYLPVFFQDIIKRSDGSLDLVITNAYIASSSNDFDNMYRDVVTANKAKYNYEEIDY